MSDDTKKAAKKKTAKKAAKKKTAKKKAAKTTKKAAKKKTTKKAAKKKTTKKAAKKKTTKKAAKKKTTKKAAKKKTAKTAAEEAAPPAEELAESAVDGEEDGLASDDDLSLSDDDLLLDAEDDVDFDAGADDPTLDAPAPVEIPDEDDPEEPDITASGDEVGAESEGDLATYTAVVDEDSRPLSNRAQQAAAKADDAPAAEETKADEEEKEEEQQQQRGRRRKRPNTLLEPDVAATKLMKKPSVVNALNWIRVAEGTPHELLVKLQTKLEAHIWLKEQDINIRIDLERALRKAEDLLGM